MGSGRRAASEKCSRNRGAGPCSLPCSGRTIQRSRRVAGACRSISWQPESVKSWPLPDFPRSAALESGRRAKPAGRPLQAVAARRMVPPAHGLDHAAEQPRLQIRDPSAAKPARSMAATPSWSNSSIVHRGLGQCAVADRPFGAAAAGARRRRAPAALQPRPFEARIDVRGIVEPLHAAREQRRGEPGPRARRAKAAAGARRDCSTRAAMPASPSGPLWRAARMATVSA